jgi:hypothetical protein
MMNGTAPGMAWSMGLICLLVIVVLILATAALVKYLGSPRKGEQE